MEIKHQPGTVPRVRYSTELAWIAMLASYLTCARKHSRIQIEDYFGGIYLATRELLAPLWKESALLDHFARSACDLTNPIWYYWIEFYHGLKRKEYRGGMIVPCSKEVAALIDQAANLARNSRRTGMKIPEVTVEHFIAALAANKHSRFASRMVSSGLNIEKVRRRLRSNGLR